MIVIGKADTQKEGETERKNFCLMVHSPSGSNSWSCANPKTRSQKLLPDLPHGYRVPWLWAVLHCFPRPQAGSWMENATAGTPTGWDPYGIAVHARAEFNH